MKRLYLLLAILPVFAGATCPTVVASNQACIYGDASTKNEDGSAFSADQLPLIYRFYRLVSDTTGTLVATSSDPSALIGGLPIGEQCFAMSAVDKKGNESVMSVVACKTLKVPAPSDGSIVAPTDGSIVYPQ